MCIRDRVYAEALPIADMLDLTLIHLAAPEVDTFFPPYEDMFVEREREDKPDYSFVTLVRKGL